MSTMLPSFLQDPFNPLTPPTPARRADIRPAGALGGGYGPINPQQQQQADMDRLNEMSQQQTNMYNEMSQQQAPPMGGGGYGRPPDLLNMLQGEIRGMEGRKGGGGYSPPQQYQRPPPQQYQPPMNQIGKGGGGYQPQQYQYQRPIPFMGGVGYGGYGPTFPGGGQELDPPFMQPPFMQPPNPDPPFMTTAAMGEEGNPPFIQPPNPDNFTTLAAGEEGNGPQPPFMPPPNPQPPSMQPPNPEPPFVPPPNPQPPFIRPTDPEPPFMTTMAIGEEGNGPQPPFMPPPGQEPPAVTMAIGEDAGGFSPNREHPSDILRRTRSVDPAPDSQKGGGGPAPMPSQVPPPAPQPPTQFTRLNQSELSRIAPDHGKGGGGYPAAPPPQQSSPFGSSLGGLF